MFVGSRVLCLALLGLSCLVLLVAGKNEKVLLKDVSAITLSRTGMTTGRRSEPIPQMNCVGGPCKWAPSTVLCSNAGFDGADVLWKCKADLEKGIKLGDISVVCEGYDYPEDPYILRGSCGLEYTLTGQAEVEKQQRYQTGHSGPYQQHNTHNQHHAAATEGSSLGTLFMWVLIAGIVYVLYKACTQSGAVGGVGGGGGGGHHPGGYPGGYPPSHAPPPAYGSDCAPPQPAQSSGPGFWSGAGLGGALGYLAGSRNRGGYQQSYSQPSSYSSGSSWGSSSGSSWAPSAPSVSSMGTSSSSAFGGTRRR